MTNEPTPLSAEEMKRINDPHLPEGVTLEDWSDEQIELYAVMKGNRHLGTVRRDQNGKGNWCVSLLRRGKWQAIDAILNSEGLLR